MNVKKMSLEELEQLSEADIAYELLKSNKKPMNTPKLFGEVCKLLEIGENAMMDMIGDFYTNLTTDKRFLLLDSAEWDLKEFHSVKMVVEEEEDDTSDEEDDETEEVSEGTEDEAVTPNAEDYDDTDEDMDDIEDLAIVTEEEMDE